MSSSLVRSTVRPTLGDFSLRLRSTDARLPPPTVPLMPRVPAGVSMSEKESRIMVRTGVRLSLSLNSSATREGDRLTDRLDRGGALPLRDNAVGGVGEDESPPSVPRFDDPDEGPMGGSVADAERCCCRDEREYLSLR